MRKEPMCRGNRWTTAQLMDGRSTKRWIGSSPWTIPSQIRCKMGQASGAGRQDHGDYADMFQVVDFLECKERK